MIQKFLISSLCVLSSVFSFSQTTGPYSLSWKHESIYAVYSAVGLATIYSLNKNIEGHTQQEIENLQSNTINAFDRETVYKYSDQKAHISDYAVVTSCAISVGLSGIVSLHSGTDSRSFLSHAGTLAVLWAETNAITMITTNIAKSSIQRTRPYVYNSNVPIEKQMEVDGRKSFFSGHTAFTASNCYFAAHVISQYYPKSWLSYSTWTAAALLPASVAYLRVQSGRHFPTDVMTGYIVGAACGVLIPQLHTLKADGKSQVHVGISPQLMSVSLRF